MPSPSASPRLIEPGDILAINGLVSSLNTELARVIAKYGPEVEIRTDHGYAVGEYAKVRVEIVHGRMRLDGSPLPTGDGGQDCATDPTAPSAERDVSPGQSWALRHHRTLAEVGNCDTCASVARCLNAGPGGACHHHSTAPTDPALEAAPDPAASGITALDMVRSLVAQGERITGASLARYMGCSQVTGSRRLAGLEAAGHVRRTGTGAGTCYELVTEASAAADEAPAPAPKLTITLPPPACSTSAPRPAPKPAGRETLPEDVLRGSPIDPDPAPASAADIDTVVEWLVAQGDKIEPGTGGTWRMAGSPRWSDRDLLNRANAKRERLGLPPFSLRRG